MPECLAYAYFVGSGTDGMRLATSEDGLTWKACGSAVVRPAPDTLMRDPFLFVHNSCYHLLWTQGWKGSGIGYSTSADLLHWDSPRTLQPMPEGWAENAWAPKAVYCPDTADFLLTWASQLCSEAGSARQPQRMYASRASSDWRAFTEPIELYAPGKSVIDGAVFRHGGRWGMVVKDESPVDRGGGEAAGAGAGAGSIEVMGALHCVWSDEAAGSYAALGPATSMGQPGCKLEGPAVYCPSNGSGSVGEGGEIWVFAEAYVEQRMRLLVHDGEAWCDRSAALVMPKGCCHGSVCAISETTLAGLIAYRDRDVPPAPAEASSAAGGARALTQSPPADFEMSDAHRAGFASELETIIRSYAGAISNNPNENLVSELIYSPEHEDAGDGCLVVVQCPTGAGGEPGLHLPAFLSAGQRQEVHRLCALLLLHHPSHGEGPLRHIVISRVG